MPESNDDQQSPGEDLEKEIEELIRDGTHGKPTLREIADTKAAEYRRWRNVEAGHPSEEDEDEGGPEGSSGE